MSYVVYRHTFPNNKVYIGITGQRPEKRWRNGFGYTHNRYLKDAIQKFGWDNVKHEILLEGLTKEQSEQKEIELIADHKSNQREHGYNLSTGGENGARGVIREYTWNKGKTGVYSQEVKERISNGLKKYYATHESTSATKYVKGQKAWNKGKKTPCEVRQKLSEAHKKLKGENAPRSRAVVKLSLQGEAIAIYASARDAAEKNNLKKDSNSLILRCCKGETKTAYGYKWKFYEE